MAKYDVNYNCGHTGEVQLYGPGKERTRRLEWMERGVCPACYRAEKEKERQQENERAAKLTTEIGFSPLTGSEKQITWAQSIRQKSYEDICKLGKPHPVYGYSLIAEALSLELSAKWWIDNRDNGGYNVFKLITANHPQGWATIQAKSTNTVSA